MISELEGMPFEDALAELEQIVGQLEMGDLTLESSLRLFERGQALARYCQEQLDAAAFRVEQLSEHGEMIEVNTD